MIKAANLQFPGLPALKRLWSGTRVDLNKSIDLNRTTPVEADQRREDMPSVLLAPTNFASMPMTIASALKRRGYRCDHILYGSADSTFKFPVDRLVDHSKAGGRVIGQGDTLAKVLAENWDIFHFWNKSLFYQLQYDFYTGLDLPLIKARGKKIIWRFTGADVRLPERDLETNPHSMFRYGFNHPIDIEKQKDFLRFIADYVDEFIVQDPELKLHWPGARIIPRAIDLTEWPYVGPSEQADHVPLILHAPTHPVVKGSAFVRTAVEQLRDEGLRFEYEFLDHVPQQEFRSWMHRADIVVDQLHLGLGVTTLEAWATGKAVVCNLRPEIFSEVYGSDIPVATANPDTVKDVLRNLIVDRDWRIDISRRGRKLVEKHHDINNIIENYIDLYASVHKRAFEPPRGVEDVRYFTRHTDVYQTRFRQLERLKRDRSQRPAQENAVIPAAGDPEVLRLNTLIDTQAKKLEKQSIHMAKLKEKITAQNERLSKLKQSTQKRITALREAARRSELTLPVQVALRFALACEPFREVLRAESYVGHGVQMLPTLRNLVPLAGGRAYCDVIEIPSFADRILASRHPDVVTRIQDAANGQMLRECDGLITIGYELGRELGNCGVPVHVIPNFRKAERFTPSDILRKECNLAAADRLVLCISTIASGFEDILGAMSLLPENVHLATMGRFVPEAYRETVETLVEKMGIRDRVHFFGPVPYGELTSTASSADIGLIVRDPAVKNNMVSLPNRVFDYICSGLPYCTPNIPDIARIAVDNKCGVVVQSLNPAGWSAAISHALEHSAEMRINALAAGAHMNWESLEDNLYSALGSPASVTFLGIKSLTENNRTLRMAESLAKRKAKVIICTTAPESDDREIGTIFEMSDGVQGIYLY